MNDQNSFTPLEVLVITAVVVTLCFLLYGASRVWVNAGKPGRTVEVPRGIPESHGGHQWIHHPDCKCSSHIQSK